MAFGMQGEGSIVDDSTTSLVVVQDGKEHVTGILFSGQKRREPRQNTDIHREHWTRRQRQNKKVNGHERNGKWSAAS